MVDFSVIMVGGAIMLLVHTLLGVLMLKGGYCDRRHAHGAVKAPAHMPNFAVLALSSSAL